MVTRYRAKATKAISVFSPFWHILLTKQDLRKKSGRESKTEQPQFKSGSPLTSLEEAETTERSMILSLSSKYEWN